ncbi:pyrroline-5-carboxylate reductase [Oscillibacter hominis]|uniref:Pyrroline-5-carboxylate reductase n=2 Tax=Oscillibacter hominis TaxID=2763056 RepID=A0A7G9B6Z4_9FIRM|nr:pyrroline-5-carboxylate reductase [Oscillibacter hominis]
MAILGFIGTGNMGTALATAACKTAPLDQVLLSNRTRSKAESLAAKLGCRVSDNETIAGQADYIFLGVKPQMIADLLSGIAPILKERGDGFILVSMAPGLTTADIQHLAGGSYPVLRIMPNTPSSIGEGMILYAPGEGVSREQTEEFLSLMSGAGLFCQLPERLIDAGSAVSGCGPAFVNLFVEAMADGGVACGLPRAQALEMAAQMTAGTARLILATGDHPGVLKDAVCSPGGSTIQGVRTLEQGAFRATVMDAVIAAYQKNQSLGK